MLELHGSYMRCSQSYFNRIWRTYCPDIKTRSGDDASKCSLCAHLSDKLRATTGVQSTADEEAVQRATDERERHLEVLLRALRASTAFLQNSSS